MTVSNNKKNLKKSGDETNTSGYHFNYALMLAMLSLVLLAIVFGFLYFIFFIEIKDLKSSKDILLKNLISRANLIHKKRYSVKNDFEKLLNQNLSELGMNNSEIKIDLSKTESIQKNGFSEGRFLLKSNKGDKYSDLRNIASGGEVSRIMLSIKSILSSYIKLSTIIFDEIDTGISGSVSSKVADLMDQMSKNMQVIVITHTPQVASKGDFHYKVFKKEVENKIITDIKLLNDKERVKEIAEMLSGDKSNKSANDSSVNEQTSLRMKKLAGII